MAGQRGGRVIPLCPRWSSRSRASRDTIPRPRSISHPGRARWTNPPTRSPTIGASTRPRRASATRRPTRRRSRIWSTRKPCSGAGTPASWSPPPLSRKTRSSPRWPRAHGWTRVPAGRKLGVFWEVYGVDPAGGAVAVSLDLARQSTGFLRRVLGLGRRRHDVRLEWQDVPQDSAVAPRALAIDLAGLAPGRYQIEVDVTPTGGSTLATRPEIRIERP